MRGNITRRGRESWRLRFDVGADANGKRKVASVTIRGTKRDAEAELRKRLGAVDNGNHIERTKITVAEYVRERVDNWYKAGKITLRTRERYDTLVQHQIVQHLGSRTLQGLRTIDIEQWHATLRTAGRADGAGGLQAGTIRSAHQVLNKALREGVKHGLVARNVCSSDGGESAPRATTIEVEIIPAEAIGDVVTKLRGRAIYPKAIISLFMGMRRGEVLALRWGCIDFNGKLIKVREAVEETRGEGLRIKAPKTSAGVRDLVMPDIVIESLQAVRRETLERHIAMGFGRPTDDTLVFPRIFDGSCQSPNVYSGDWRGAVLALGLPDVSLHALRHTHASQLIDAGVDIVRISKRLGHADPSVTLRVYGHLFRKRDDMSAEAINAALGTIARPA